MKHPRSLLRRAVGAAAAFVVASAALVNAGNSPARADQNTDIKFGPVTLTHVTDTGEAIPAPGRQLHKGDWFHLNVDFDATRANPKPGQSFAIDLPEPFVNRDGGNSRGDVIKPLEYTDSQGATVKAGECKVDRSRITCTFGDAIEGKLDVSGKIQAQLLALGAIDKTSSVLTINGKEYTVAHPWNEDITLRPAVQKITDSRIKAVNARWLQFLNSKTLTGEVRYSDRESGLVWWRKFFRKVLLNERWCGGSGIEWTADFDWIVKQSNFVKILEWRPAKREEMKHAA